MISGLSSSILQNYAQYVGNAKAFSTEDMFNTLSEELGGDGETITKEDLDVFIKKSGSDLSPTKLRALETLQSSWKTISGGKDSISFDNMKGYTSFLGLIYTSDRITPMTSGSSSAFVKTFDSSDAKARINDILISNAISGKTDSTESALSNYLKELLSENSDENDNSDDIDAVVNMMAAFTSVRSSVIDPSLVRPSADYRV